jgi:hypothetical protein
MPSQEPKRTKRITIAEYYKSWIERKLPPLVRPSRARDYRNHFRTYILPSMTDVELAGFSLEHLEDLRLRLHAKHGLGIKTVRNVIDSSLRAMFRDARKAGLEVALPFGDLEWPRRVVPGPDPFTEVERDRLLEYLAQTVARRPPSGSVRGKGVLSVLRFSLHAILHGHAPLRGCSAQGEIRDQSISRSEESFIWDGCCCSRLAPRLATIRSTEGPPESEIARTCICRFVD